LYQAVETGKLVRRSPIRSLGAPVRELYVTPEVARALDGDDAGFKHCPMVEIERLIAIFEAGYLVRCSMIGSHKKKPDFERLTDLEEVWVACARKPWMWQLRIMGRFLDKGVFIGLQIYERIFLGSPENYNKIASAIPDVWTSIFGVVPAFSARNVDDYLGGVVFDVDEI
jgi:hypothetical protein